MSVSRVESGQGVCELMLPQLGKGRGTCDSAQGGWGGIPADTHEDHRAWGVTWQCLRGGGLTVPTGSWVVWDRT